MTADAVVVRHDGESVIGVLRLTSAGAAEEVPRARRAADELALRLDDAARIAWVDVRAEPFLLPVAEWPALLRNELELLHLGGATRTDAAAPGLQRIEHDSPWVLPAAEGRRLTTWLVSPAAGVASTAALRAIGVEPRCGGLAATLFDAARRGIELGLLPRSEPALLQTTIPEAISAELQTVLSATEAARLVGRLRGRRWVWVWALGRLLFDRRLAVVGLAAGLTAPRPSPPDATALWRLHPPAIPATPATVEVVIPSLGRPGPLRDVLADLAAQTLLPTRVHVVDQRPGGSTPSRPDWRDGAWPFSLRPTTVPWAGACRSRNLALAVIDAGSDWVLFLDDDVRLGPEVLAGLVDVARRYGADVVNAAVLRVGQVRDDGPVPGRASPVLAGGAALVSRRALDEAGRFDERLEGGYGEDTELGARLRRAGCLVLQAGAVPVLHLKAPAGGFRASLPLPWDGEPVAPRPSPVYLLSRRLWATPEMEQGYRMTYVLERLRRDGARALPRILREWRAAETWSTRLDAGKEDR